MTTKEVIVPYSFTEAQSTSTEPIKQQHKKTTDMIVCYGTANTICVIRISTLIIKNHNIFIKNDMQTNFQ